MTSAATIRQATRATALLAFAVGLMLAVPHAARAVVLCDEWTASAGKWSEGKNWKLGRPPLPMEAACIPAGDQAELSLSTEVGTVGVLSGTGAVKIDSGELRIENVLESSHIGTLTMSGGSGVLTGAATLDITGTLTWTAGTMTGSGSTVVQSSASGTVAGKLKGRVLVNEGSLTGTAELSLTEAAQLQNKGTLTENVQDETAKPGTYAVLGDSTTLFVNTGKLRHTEGIGFTHIEAPFTNEGTVEALAGTLQFRGKGTSTASGTWMAAEGTKPAKLELDGNFVTEEGNYTFTGGTLSGHLQLGGSSMKLSTTGTTMTSAVLNTANAKWQTPSGTETIAGLEMTGGTLEGAGNVRVSGRFELTSSNPKMTGTGKTIVERGVEGHISGAIERTLINEGTLTIPEAELYLGKEGLLENFGVLTDNYEAAFSIGVATKDESRGVVNYGVFQRAACGERKCEPGANGIPGVEPLFVNRGWILQKAGPFHFNRLVQQGHAGWGCTSENPSYPKREYDEEAGVCTGTGDLSETQSDLKIGGTGIGLNVTRTYNSQLAEKEAKAGKPTSIFGYGWSSPYSTHVAARTEYTGLESEFEVGEPPKEAHYLTMSQENGTTIEFFESSPGNWQAPPGCPDIVTGTPGTGYTVKLENQQTFKFNGTSGLTESEADRYGNVTHFKYNGEGRLESVEDPGKRLLKFGPYNSEGLVETIEDPMGHHLAYHYTAGKLSEVSELGEPEKARWKLEYGENARLTQIENAIGGKTKITYTEGRVATKTDPVGNSLKYEYLPGQATVTNESTKAVTVHYTTSLGILAAISRGVGTLQATTESFTYNKEGDTASKTDGNGNTTHYEYSSGNKIREEDPEKHVRKWTYDTHHDVKSEETPDKELTTYELEENGNPKEVSRAAPEAKTQTTKYTYETTGKVKTQTNPLGKVTEYGYDAYGDKSKEIDPEGDERTWKYTADSQVEQEVAPRGHVKGETEAKYTTTTKRYPTNLIEEVIAPLAHAIKYKYDGDGNRTETTDPEKHVTKTFYTVAGQRRETEAPNKTKTKVEYDGAGELVKRVDGNEHATEYKRNTLEQISEIVERPGAGETEPRITKKAYDAAGNLREVIDPLKQKTTYEYNEDNRLKRTSYSDGKTHAAEYTYNGDGSRESMTDASGTTEYHYDILNRLESVKNGHGATVKYSYDLANQPEKLTYPSGKAITDGYDNAGRLHTITDFASGTITFNYDANSDLKATVFPVASKNEDTYGYDEADQMNEAQFKTGATLTASIKYERNEDGQVTKMTDSGLAGESEYKYGYDENSRLKEGGVVKYGYDNANNVTGWGLGTFKYDEANQLTTLEIGGEVHYKYEYNKIGQRLKRIPTKVGTATTYEYDQAGNLIAANRPAGTAPKIEDTYTYNGDGLRVSRTSEAKTTNYTWDLGGRVPLLLSDETHLYIYGPGSSPIEQTNSEGANPQYLHTDQQSSVRMITSATGEKVGSVTYQAYGYPEASNGTVTSALGYDGQYTDTDAGLIYLRARYYDTATAQFLTVDPQNYTQASWYTYAGDNPLAQSDPSGEEPWSKKVKEAMARCSSESRSHNYGTRFWKDKRFYRECQVLLHSPKEPWTPKQRGNDNAIAGCIIGGGAVGAIGLAAGAAGGTATAGALIGCYATGVSVTGYEDAIKLVEQEL